MEDVEIAERLKEIKSELKDIRKRLPKLAAWSKASVEFQKMRLAFDVAASSKDVEEAKARMKMLRELVKEMAG
ncbi:MAG: hypothetical protein JRN45_00675 [Nitrososphaerota archaeon]|nr:hypothetical protein [Nitrososphaerota archaeon]